MQKTKKLSLVFLSSLLPLIIGKTDVLALSHADNRLQKSEDIRDNGCEILNNRIDARIQLFEQNKEYHKNIYEALVRKVEDLIDWMSEKGLVINKLQSDLIVLSDLLTKAWEDYSSFISLLMETKSYTCGESQGQFREKLMLAFEELKNYKADVMEIRNYYKNTVKEDMRELRDLYKELRRE